MPGFIVEGLQCFSCDKNDIFTGADTCGDTAVTTEQNTKQCSVSESFCMHVMVTKGGSTQQSEKMGCAGDVESFFASAGVKEALGFCGNIGAGCYRFPDVSSSEFQTSFRDIKICCCSNNL